MTAAVVHVTAAEGGGTDRYLRDLAAHTSARHWIWHAGSHILEDVAARRFHAAPSGAGVARWVQAAGIGLVHLHGMTPACRDALDALRSAAALPYVITLHDVQFVAPDAFATTHVAAGDVTWLAAMRTLLADAAAVVAPSAYIAELARRHFGVDTVRIEPGIVPAASPPSTSPRDDAVQLPAGFVVAVLGALGPHKGSLLLAPVARALRDTMSDAALVVIGYTDTQVERGVDATGSYRVHGPYEDAELPALLRAYGVDVVLFPNRLPESFSYTLSEAWTAGMPVIVPAAGALGERVAAHGGGWLLTDGFDADAAAALIARLRSPGGAAEWAQVHSALAASDAARVPLLSAMAQSFDALYRRFALHAEASATPDATLQPLVAANLDGMAFRRELVYLADEREKLRAWVAKLDTDIASLSASVAALQQQNRELEDVRAAFTTLPAPAQKALFKWAFRARR